MVDFEKDLPINGYVMAMPNGNESVWCENCYESGSEDGELFTKIIRQGQLRAGNRSCEDCGAVV